MVAAVLNLTGERAIELGSFYGLQIYYPGDLTGATVKGVLKDKIGGKTLTSFKALPFSYDAISGKTLIYLYLTAADTRRLTTPENAFVYDALVTVPNVLESPFRLIQGIGTLSLGVTDA